MRKQLLLLIGITTVLVLTSLLIPLGLLAQDHAEDHALADASVRGESVAAVISRSFGDGEVTSAADRRMIRDMLDGVNAEGQPRASVVLPDGQTFGPAPRSVSKAALKLARSGRTFTYAAGDGDRIHLMPVLVTGGEGKKHTDAVVVQVAVDKEQLRSGVWPSWFAVAGLGAALTLLGLAFADRLASHLVRSTRRLGNVADQLAAGNLQARADPMGPLELRLLAHRLNELGEQIGTLLAAERERVADLAHRLRTPLTALRLEAETLQDEAAVRRVSEGVTALEQSVNEVIRTARSAVDPDSGQADLSAVAQERTRFWAPLAEEQSRAAAVWAPPWPVPVAVSAEDLRAVLDALIGNVLDHTPEGTDVRVTVTDDGRLLVDDDGPGIPGSALTARGESGAGSTGLGLDIARRTAEESGGSFALGAGPDGRGTRVDCRFGTARSETRTAQPPPQRRPAHHSKRARPRS
ncbi:signal transduction histidine kinase [Streptomyces sp. Amel2xB2]|uniref:sensor histidine kinase n=1 Tax=Streptomyces sp. Amel2xB2 TaxID=1305829 RepID=UPI000DBA67E4|nr:HAMP domain-containing sensor histidine kinase [Streptomyces sp. Amel2xB2]RAJ71302.1 signal transduction histidine kinase [Streptomyces sp. Amel2xB2]